MKLRLIGALMCAIMACATVYAEDKPAAQQRQPSSIKGVLNKARGGPASEGTFLADVTGTEKGLPAEPGEGSCCASNGTVGCNDLTCQSKICTQDPFCCDIQWDGVCADAALEQCAVCKIVIPTLNNYGRTFLVLVLLLAGGIALTVGQRLRTRA